MGTKEKILEHAASIIENGGPKTKEEINIVNMALAVSGKTGKAFNAGKRNDKHFQQTGK